MAGQKNPEDRNFGAGNETRERDSKVVRLLPRRNYRLIWLTLSTKSVERHDPAGEGSVAPEIGAEYEAALHGGGSISLVIRRQRHGEKLLAWNWDGGRRSCIARCPGLRRCIGRNLGCVFDFSAVASQLGAGRISMAVATVVVIAQNYSEFRQSPGRWRQVE